MPNSEPDLHAKLQKAIQRTRAARRERDEAHREFVEANATHIMANLALVEAENDLQRLMRDVTDPEQPYSEPSTWVGTLIGFDVACGGVTDGRPYLVGE